MKHKTKNRASSCFSGCPVSGELVAAKVRTAQGRGKSRTRDLYVRGRRGGRCSGSILHVDSATAARSVRAVPAAQLPPAMTENVPPAVPTLTTVGTADRVTEPVAPK